MTRPNRINVDRNKQTLTLGYEGLDDRSFSAEMLRVFSPSAEVQGHSEEQRKLVGGKRSVRIADILPVGNYAIRIVFDDGHDTGLFSWVFFDELEATKETRWQTYLSELEKNGLSR